MFKFNLKLSLIIQLDINDFMAGAPPTFNAKIISTDVLSLTRNFYSLSCYALKPNYRASEAPNLITQICYMEINCAVNPSIMVQDPYLSHGKSYNTISLTKARNWERRMEACSEEVQRWLRLSIVCPLSITIMPTGNENHSWMPLHNHRQLELGYFAPNSNALKRIINLTANHICMLRELRLHELTDGHSKDLWFQCAFLAAQGLRSICIAREIHV